MTDTTLAQRLREGRTDGTDLRWLVTDIHCQAADALDAKDAEIARLTAANKALTGAKDKAEREYLRVWNERDAQRRRAEAAEAELTEVRKRLAGVREAIMSADTTVLTDTLWMPDHLYKGGTVVDFIDSFISSKEPGQ